MPKVKLKDHLELLEILRLWLEDMLPVIRAVESLFDMPKAKRCDPPWQEYHHVPEVISEMNRAESQIWNEARAYVLNRLKGKS